jgi:hypothetical protein
MLCVNIVLSSLLPSLSPLYRAQRRLRVLHPLPVYRQCLHDTGYTPSPLASSLRTYSFSDPFELRSTSPLCRHFSLSSRRFENVVKSSADLTYSPISDRPFRKHEPLDIVCLLFSRGERDALFSFFFFSPLSCKRLPRRMPLFEWHHRRTYSSAASPLLKEKKSIPRLTVSSTLSSFSDSLLYLTRSRSLDRSK